jgi:hypothetical protein
MPPNAPVEVRTRYDGQWAQGFEVAEETPTGYRLRRLSDNAVLPEEFTRDDVRGEVD